MFPLLPQLNSLLLSQGSSLRCGKIQEFFLLFISGSLYTTFTCAVKLCYRRCAPLSLLVDTVLVVCGAAAQPFICGPLRLRLIVFRTFIVGADVRLPAVKHSCSLKCSTSTQWAVFSFQLAWVQHCQGKNKIKILVGKHTQNLLEPYDVVNT